MFFYIFHYFDLILFLLFVLLYLIYLFVKNLFVLLIHLLYSHLTNKFILCLSFSYLFLYSSNWFSFFITSSFLSFINLILFLLIFFSFLNIYIVSIYLFISSPFFPNSFSHNFNTLFHLDLIYVLYLIYKSALKLFKISILSLVFVLQPDVTSIIIYIYFIYIICIYYYH